MADGVECSEFFGISNQQQSLHSAVPNAERDGVGRAAIDPGDDAELTVDGRGPQRSRAAAAASRW